MAIHSFIKFKVSLLFRAVKKSLNNNRQLKKVSAPRNRFSFR